MKRIVLLLLALPLLFLVTCTGPDTVAELPSTSLTGYRVLDRDGKVIARVEDILISADSGQISYALVILRRDPFSSGKAAFVDATIPRTAVPWDQFTIDPGSKELHLRADGPVIYAAPLLLDKPEHLANGWDADIRAYWQVQ